MKPLESALRGIGVEPAERSLFGWGMLVLFLVGAASYAVLNAAETLFLKRVGVAYLPWVLLASSGLLVTTTAFASRGLAVADRPRWLPRVFLMLAVVLLPFGWLAVGSGAAGVFGALVLVARQILALGLMVFWMALGDLVTGRQAKRLFAPLASGITLGGIVGSFGSDGIARVVGIEGLALVSAGLLVAAALAAWRLRASRPPRLEVGFGAGRASRRAIRAESAGPGLSAVGIFRESRLFRLLLVALLCGGALSPALYFEFSYVADAATVGADAEQQLLALFAQFRGWLNLATLVSQLWLSGRLYRRFGLPVALALWPASYLLGFAWLSVQLGLRAGVTALGAGRVAEDGIAGSALRVLFNLFPESLRSRASGLLEGPVTRLGGMLGNGMVLVALEVGAASAIAVAAIPVAGVWLAASLALRRAYPSLLLHASADRSLAGVGADKGKLLDPATVRALAPSLADPDPDICRAALDLIVDADPAVGVGVLARALEHAPAVSRPLLVDALHRLVEPLPPGSLRSGAAIAALGRTLSEPAELPAEERADLIQVYARLTGGTGASERDARTSTELLRRALGDPEAAVRLAAIAELQRRGKPPPGVADLDAVLAGSLVGRDALMRRTARKELRAMLLSSQPDPGWAQRLGLLAARLGQRADRAETAEALVEVARRHASATRPCLEAMASRAEDRDPRVRAAVLRFLGSAGSAEEAPRLVKSLASRRAEEALAAREGLVALGPEALEPLLAQPDLGASERRDAVVAILRELDVDPATLEKLYQRQLDGVRRTVMLRAVLGADAPTLVARRLEERVSEGLGALLACLAVIQDEEGIAELERRLRRTPDERRRDLLIEGLDALLPADARAELLPLLESDSWEERGRRTGQQLGAHPLGAAEAWGELRDDPDHLTRRLAGVFAPDVVDAGGAMGNHRGVLDPMEIAVRLQAVPVFDRLSTRQLMQLAEVLVEQRVEADGAVYAEGDEGDGLYFVFEGEVVLAKQGVETERRGPGEFFGELSTLDGVPRATSAWARVEARLLRLGREDLLLLMEEAPALGIGLSQFLSLRIRALQDRTGPGERA